jgi:S-formylglutathione hydrolase FrmB
MDDVTSWTDRGRAEDLTAGLPLIVVMPDAGLGGWYSDWHNRAGAAGDLRWETHHLLELRPWIEHRYATRTDRAGRAIAGLSMGGFGALSYAARHPELFGFVAAYSGAADILDPSIGKTADFTSTTMGATAGDIWGRWPAHISNRRARNPIDLAPNLATLTVELRTGNGEPGGRHGGSDLIEAGVHGPMVRMHDRLADLSIDHVWDDYGAGAHDWPYWADDLAASLPALLAVAEDGLTPPPSVSHVAFEPAFEAWGWRVDLDRPCLEPSLLTVDADGFALTGSGRGRVTTDGRFAPHAPVSVTTDGVRQERSADAIGRVTVDVDLGPPNLVDLDDREPGAPSTATKVEVRLEPVSPPRSG